MPPTSIFPFIYCFVVIFSMLAMIASPALIGFPSIVGLSLMPIGVGLIGFAIGTLVPIGFLG